MQKTHIGLHPRCQHRGEYILHQQRVAKAQHDVDGVRGRAAHAFVKAPGRLEQRLPYTKVGRRCLPLHPQQRWNGCGARHALAHGFNCGNCGIKGSRLCGAARIALQEDFAVLDFAAHAPLRRVQRPFRVAGAQHLRHAQRAVPCGPTHKPPIEAPVRAQQHHLNTCIQQQLQCLRCHLHIAKEDHLGDLDDGNIGQLLVAQCHQQAAAVTRQLAPLFQQVEWATHC